MITFQKMAEEYKDVVFLKVNVDDLAVSTFTDVGLELSAVPKRNEFDAIWFVRYEENFCLICCLELKIMDVEN